MPVYVIILPLFMLADYYLTILGERYSKEYREHYVIKEYEVNPLWQGDVRKQKWFNPKHLVLVLAFTAIFFLFMQMLEEEDYGLVLLFVGMIAGPYITVLGRHLCNLLLFLYVKKNPTLLEGRLIIPYRYMLFSSRIMVIPGILTFLVIYAFTQSIFVLGGVIGNIILFFVHYFWTLKARKKTGKNEE